MDESIELNEFSVFVNQRKFTPERIQIEESKFNLYLKQQLKGKEPKSKVLQKVLCREI